jgi:hypothetical protein
VDISPDLDNSKDDGAAAPHDQGTPTVAELSSEIAKLKHEALVAQDTIAGLRAELVTLQDNYIALRDADIGKAYARIDLLEDEREARLHELRVEVKLHGERMEVMRNEIARVKESNTWKVGSVLIKPISKLTGRMTP